MVDRWKNITPERRAYLEKKYGGILPDKPPTLLERWEKEGEMYRKYLKKNYTKNETVDK